MTLQIFVLFALLATVLCHNWLNSPSRAGDGISRSQKASTVKPAPASPTGNPQVQVRPGQPFQVEWVIGHNRHTYLVMVAAKDKDDLAKHDARNRLLDEYFDGCPNGQKGAPAAKYAKYHRKAETSLTWDAPSVKGVPQPQIANFFAKRIMPNDPLHIRRDSIFRGSFRGARRGNIDPDDVYQFQYKAAEQATDRWCRYRNPKFPWIIGAARYLHSKHQPTRPDVALMEFPANTPAGAYIVHYRWSGFYDAIDVNLIDSPRDIANPYGAEVVLVPGAPPPPPDKFKKLDHCNYPENTRVGKCVGMKAPMGVPQACINECLSKKYEECNGVLVVPLKNPDTVYSGFRNMINAPFGTNNCANPGNDFTHVCYPLLSREGTALSFEYWQTTDAEDPAFYSTCFRRIKRIGGFDTPMKAMPVELLDWEYRGKCVSCADRWTNSQDNVTPNWQLSDVCVDCSKPENFKPPQTQAPAPPPANTNGVCGGVFGVRFDETSGKTAKTCGSANVPSLMLLGDTSFETRGNRRCVRFRASRAGYTQATWDTTNFGKAFTVGFWFRGDLIDNTERVVLSQSNPSRGTGRDDAVIQFLHRAHMVDGMPVANQHRMRMRLKVRGTQTDEIICNRDINQFTWYHIAATYDGNVMRIYQNGVQRGSRNIAGSVVGHATWPMTIGINANKRNEYRGALRMLNFHNKVFSAAEVRAMAQVQ